MGYPPAPDQDCIYNLFGAPPLDAPLTPARTDEAKTKHAFASKGTWKPNRDMEDLLSWIRKNTVEPKEKKGSTVTSAASPLSRNAKNATRRRAREIAIIEKKDHIHVSWRIIKDTKTIETYRKAKIPFAKGKRQQRRYPR